ncbi:MAG: hypothetical protein ACOY94_10425 [Bacillota bacterium]
MLEQLRRIVRRAVNEADPVQLLEMGAPEDEYGAEVDEIVRWFYPGKVSWEQSLAMAQAIHLELKRQVGEERARHDRVDGDNP